MPAKRRSASGKGAAKEAQAATRRSTRGSSAATDTKSAAGAKRKASPSPSPAPKRAASAKKGRTRSPSPTLVERPKRGRSTTKKEEPKPAEKPTSRSAGSQKGRVTRNVVQEVEVKKSTETKSRSTSRSAKSTPTPKGSAAPKNKAVTPKKKEEPPKKKETPKQKAVSQRGRSTTPRNAKETPREKAVTPKQKSLSPKQKTTPKQKQQTPLKSEPVTKKNSAKSSPVKEQKLSSPQKSPRSRRSRQDLEPVDKPDEKNSSDDDKVVSVEASEATDKDEVSNQEKEVDELEEEANEESQELKTDENEKEENMEKTEPKEEIEKIDDVENKDENEAENTEQALENIAKEHEKTEMDQSPEKEENQIAESENVKGKEESEIGEEAMEGSDTDETGQQEKTTESDQSSNMQEESNKEFDLNESKQTGQTVADEMVTEEGTESNIESKDVKENEMANFVENVETEENSVRSVDNSIKQDSVESVEINESGKDDVNKNTEVISQSETDVNNLVSAQTNYGGGDQEQSKKVGVEEISDDDIEEIDTKQENGAANIDNDDIEEIEFVEQVDKYVENTPTKRKFDDVDTELNDSSPVKKVRVSTEEDIHENGSSSQEDIAKDYVVIEMSDVPQATSSEVQSSLPNPIFNRTFIPNPTFSGASDTSKQFSVVSYNMLADCHLFKNDYSFTEARFLQPEYRLKKVIEELQYLDGDIVCMQEVDPQFFADQLLPSMRSLGYEGVHKQREAEYYNEGEATFFKTSRFEVIETEASSFSKLLQKELEGIEPTIQEAVKKYTDLPDVIIVAKLKCKNTGHEVTIGNVHIQWGEMKVPDAQCVQIASAVKEIVSKATGDNFPHIICGDFNSPPMSPGYLVARDGYPSGDETINTLMKIENLELPEGKKASLVNSLWPAFQHTSSSLRSAYSEAQGYEPEITSYNCVMCNCVDYIFYSSMSLENVGVLQTASKEKIMETGGIPNCYFPSDHVSLKSVLSFK